MKHSIYRVVGFESIGPYTLRVKFDDGQEREIDFRTVLAGELYGPLKDEKLFNQVEIDPEVHTLVWPTGADFDPETLVIAHWHEGIDWDSSDIPEWEGLESRVDTINNFVEATTESFSSFGLFLSEESTGVSGDGLPSTFTLKQNSPNPFNPTTVIEFSLPEAGYVTLTVYNLTGQEVARLVERSLPAGTHRVIFDGNNYSSGIYFYQFSAPGFTETRKMLLIK